MNGASSLLQVDRSGHLYEQKVQLVSGEVGCSKSNSTFQRDIASTNKDQYTAAVILHQTDGVFSGSF